MTYQLSKYFAKGAGHATRHQNSEVILFYWHGRDDGTARYIPHVRLYARNGVEYRSLAALLRAVETEHAASVEPLIVTRSFYETLRRIGPHATRNIVSE